MSESSDTVAALSSMARRLPRSGVYDVNDLVQEARIALLGYEGGKPLLVGRRAMIDYVRAVTHRGNAITVGIVDEACVTYDNHDSISLGRQRAPTWSRRGNCIVALRAIVFAGEWWAFLRSLSPALRRGADAEIHGRDAGAVTRTRVTKRAVAWRRIIDSLPDSCGLLAAGVVVMATLAALTTGDALRDMRAGYRAKRAPWPAQHWVGVVAVPQPSPASWGSFFPSGPYLAKMSAGQVLPWTPGQDDLFAEDWEAF